MKLKLSSLDITGGGVHGGNRTQQAKRNTTHSTIWWRSHHAVGPWAQCRYWESH